MRGLTGFLDFATFNRFDFDKRGDGKNQQKEKDISLIEGSTNIDLAQNIEGDVEGDNFIDDSTKIELVQNLSMSNMFTDEISNIFESNEELSSNLLPNLSIKQMGQQIVGDTTNNVIELGSKDNNQGNSSGFQGLTAVPSLVAVDTRFSSGGGTIDRFEAASSLRSYGVFS